MATRWATATGNFMRSGGELGETLRVLALLFLATLLLRGFVLAPFSIPSQSMLPRMMAGDYLFVAKWPYGWSRLAVPLGLGSFEGRLFGRLPARGDVVVFRYPDGGDEDYVKRVIGLPGDIVQLRGGQLWLNGAPVPRTRISDFLMPVSPNSPCHSVAADGARLLEIDGRRFCAFARYRETLPDGTSFEVLDQARSAGDDTGPFRVPADHLFVMGDNRDDSEDSRFPVARGGVGLLPADHLIGRALITFFSTDGSARWSRPLGWAQATRWDRIGGTF